MLLLTNIKHQEYPLQNTMWNTSNRFFGKMNFIFGENTNPMKLETYGQVDQRVMKDPRINVTAKAVYACLTCYADNETNTCYPSVARITADPGIGYRTVSRHIKVLVKYNVITRADTSQKL